MNIPFNTLRPNDPRCTVFNTCRDRLHHYTSVETLGLILKNRTIRFNRLDRVNDPRESFSDEYSMAQTLVFASCWTSGGESLPHWGMYAGLSGVRLTLPTLMFKGRCNNHKITADDRLYQISIQAADAAGLPTIERRGEEYVGLTVARVYGPTRIQYVEYEDLATGNVYPGRTTAKYDLRMLGTKKHKDWEYEQEIRFRLLASFGYSFDVEQVTRFLTPESFVKCPVVTQYVDIPLDGGAIAEAEILLGPKITTQGQKLVEDLCAKHAPTVTVKRSSIPIR